MRIKPLWKSKIQTKIKSGEKVLIVAHGNSLRAIIQILENHSDEEIMNINIPTGNPLIYALNSNLQTLEKNYLL
jgi:2,3-bisphosphoglycerate-dependent phosphoglycerate mutase